MGGQNLKFIWGTCDTFCLWIVTFQTSWNFMFLCQCSVPKFETMENETQTV